MMSCAGEYNPSAEEQKHEKNEICEDPHDSGTAKIISNELLLVGVCSRVENMDELTSLEREIAEMHHVDPPKTMEYLGGDNLNSSNSDASNQAFCSEKASLLKSKLSGTQILDNINPEEATNFPQSDTVNEGSILPEENECTALEHEDLIAVLKGIDEHTNIINVKVEKDDDHDQQYIRPPSITESELAEGVTIEGEGQFQIMEVVYDELDEHETISKETEDARNIQASSSQRVVNNGASAISHLTSEEIRAMAMEQIAGLNARGGDRQRKRKQDIKPLKVEESSDLVSSLGADWSDDDNELASKASSGLVSSKQTNSTTEFKNRKNELEKDISNQEREGKESTNKNTDLNVVKLEKVESDNLHEDTLPMVEPLINDAPTIKPVVGFKRTRIIKPKIIWDPDAPETQISYAQFARNSSKLNLDAESPSSKIVSHKTSASKNQHELKEKKSSVQRQNDPENKQHRGSELKVCSGSPATKKKETRSSSPAGNSSNRNKNVSQENTMKTQSPVKRRSQTPIINGTGSGAGSKKKKLSEIDRLVSDEGAANMLHSLESERSKLIAEQGVDKPQKHLMRSRAATISEKILKRESTPTSGKTTPTSGKTTPIPTNSGGTRNKRNSKQKPSSTWDYVYKQKASEDAMIIRRRSNSSYSSNASVRRLSLDTAIPNAQNASKTTATTKAGQQKLTPTTTTGTSSSVTKTTQRSLLKTSNENNNASVESSDASISAKISAGNSFEFAKPESKSNQKNNRRVKGVSHGEESSTNETKKPTVTPGTRKGSRSPASVDERDKNKSTGVSAKVSPKQTKEDSPAGSNASDVVVKKVAKVAQIVFNTQKAKINYTFTAQMLNKLVDILEKLSKDAECNAVVITTNAPNFCHGIDFTDLTFGTLEKRKLTAVYLATAVKNYLKMLATFPKPLVAGVSGSNIGLGVTQLPLFDVVIGSDKGSYETPYVKIGQVPEGYCFWNNSTKIRDNYKTKLFWLGEKLHSTESALSGLVHKLTASGKVNEDALLTAKKLAAMSSESYRFMKKAVITNHLETINKSLDEEFETIIEQWTSAESYESFKKYLESGHF
ncbi:chromodomain Y-like protein [Rhagoletis pomonella]|uniref:chromodomain Y-like protein n=1 Tax=Rhagoletis pomonella TaxID=28610 RepID=UPI00177D484F|nr:chromodomain Y-like protein [Rhagoletis pomonella]